MKNFKLSYFLFSIFFICLSNLYAFETDWGPDFKISIRQVSDFASELKIIELKTSKVLHESLIGMHHIIKTKKKKISSKDIFFVQATTGGEGMVSSNLYYFFLDGKELKQGSVEDIIEFSLRDLDGDKNSELILTDFKYYKFSLNNCYNSLEPDPHYSGKLLPTLFKFRNDKFYLEKKDTDYLKNYLNKLEKKLLKKKKFKNLRGFSHYYAIAKKLGLEKQALAYFKSNNSVFIYSCQNTNEQNPKGRSFLWKTTYFDFFKKYGKKIN